MVAPSEVYVRAVWRDVGLNQTGLRRGCILIERFGAPFVLLSWLEERRQMRCLDVEDREAFSADDSKVRIGLAPPLPSDQLRVRRGAGLPAREAGLLRARL